RLNESFRKQETGNRKQETGNSSPIFCCQFPVSCLLFFVVSVPFVSLCAAAPARHGKRAFDQRGRGADEVDDRGDDHAYVYGVQARATEPSGRGCCECAS